MLNRAILRGLGFKLVVQDERDIAKWGHEVWQHKMDHWVHFGAPKEYKNEAERFYPTHTFGEDITDEAFCQKFLHFYTLDVIESLEITTKYL